MLIIKLADERNSLSAVASPVRRSSCYIDVTLGARLLFSCAYIRAYVCPLSSRKNY